MHHSILHVANFSPRPKGAGFASVQFKLTNGLIRAGHNVVTFSDRDVARASTPLRSRKIGVPGANRRLLELVSAFRPDIVLFGHADTIQPATLMEIRNRLPGIRLAQWNVDPLFEDDNVARIRAKIDYVDRTFVTTAGPLLQELAKAGAPVAFMPNPVDPAIEYGCAFDRDDLPYDVFYAVGSPRIGRRHCGVETNAGRIIRNLRKRLPKLTFLTPGIDGNHLEGAPGMAALNSAKIGLNISRRNDVHLYSSDRMAHLAGNGLVVMIDRASGYGDLFAEDELGFYGSEDELAAKLERFAGDAVLRKATAKRGWGAYHAMFDATRVAEYMIGVLDGWIDPATFRWAERGPAFPNNRVLVKSCSL